ncbi:MAG: sigma-70 family RNA polymerase sigma factor [Planctomycetota bacterium]
MTTSDGTIDVERLLAERDWLRRLALRLLGDEQDADDLVQETMRAALERAPRGLEGGSLRAWLTTVARRASSYRWRSDAHRRARERDAARTEALPSTEEAVQRAATQRLLADSVMALDEPLRSAVVLRYYEELSYADVARRQGVTPIAARKRVSRGIEILRARLDEGSNGDRAAWTAALAPVASLGRRGTEAVQGAALMQAKTKWAAVAVAVVLGAVGITAWVGLRASDGEQGPSVRPIVEVRSTGDEEIAELEEVAEIRRVEAVAAAEAPKAPGARAAFPDRGESVVGTLEIRVTWASDGTSAGGVVAEVLPWGEQNANLWKRRKATDEGGIACFGGVHAGTVGIYLDRGGYASADVEAGRATRVDVTVPRGVEVVGRVLDPRGRPVSGAIIELSDYGSHSQGSAIETSGADGRYRVRDVSEGHDISARAAGFAPSGQVEVDGPPGSTIELDLVLGGVGGRIAGEVFDENGTPLEDATVVISPSGAGGDLSQVSGRWVNERPLPVARRTDVEGRFVADGLGAYHHTIQVRTAMHAPLRQSIAVEEGGEHEVLLQMRLGRTLTGIVRRADGAPARAASISVRTSNHASSHAAKADEDGRFRIDAIGLREFEVFAIEKDHGKTRAKLRFEESGPLHWEATLVPGNHASGVLVDPSGAPIPGWFVWACEDDPGLFHRDTRVDAQGRFELKDIPPSATHLAVGPADRLSIGIAHVVPNAVSSDRDVRIVVPDAARPTGEVTGVVRDASGELSPETSIRLTQRGAKRWQDAHPAADGGIEVTRVYPGTWDVAIEAPGRAPWFGTVEVPASGTGDLGEVILGAGGFVQLSPTLVDPAGDRSIELTIERVTAAGDAVQWDRLPPEGGRCGPYPEGRIRLRVRGRNCAATFVDVDVVRSETVHAQVVLEPGVRSLIQLVHDDDRAARGVDSDSSRSEVRMALRSASYRVRNVAGEIVDSAQDAGFVGEEFSTNGLRPGRYTIEVWDDLGRRGYAEFDVVPGVDPQDEARTTVVLRVRR